MQTAKTLIRLWGCPGWSDSSLGAHAILYVLSCASSNMSGSGRKHTFGYVCSAKIQAFHNVPSEESDQPVCMHRLIRIFTGHIMDSQGCKVSSSWRQWSEYMDELADLNFRWGHMPESSFCRVVTHVVILIRCALVLISPTFICFR